MGGGERGEWVCLEGEEIGSRVEVGEECREEVW